MSREILSLDRLYDYYLGVILKLTRTRGGSILLVDEVSKDLIVVATKGKGSEGPAGRHIPMGEGIAGTVALSGHSYITPDPGNEPSTRRGNVRANVQASHSVLCVPLKIRQRVQGVVEILNKKNRKPFLREDLNLLDSIAIQVATVIENVRLFEKYDHKVHKLRTLKEISRVLNSTLDEGEVKRRSVESAAKLMDAEAGFLLLIDEESRELYFDVASGDRGGGLKELRLKLGEGVVGWVAQSGQPAIVADAQHDHRFSGATDEIIGNHTKNLICVPIKIKDRTIGVLEAINKKDNQTFSQWDMEEFQSLADQVAIAIDNANLYKDLREAFFGTAEAFGDAIEAKDAYTAGHTRRVLYYTMVMGRHLGLSGPEMDNLKLSALLHDIGKIGIEDNILRKPGKLDEVERRRMEDHTTIGPRIVDRVRPLRKIVPGIMHHHEEYDGSGYPSGLKGEEIPLAARIIAVADCFDAMTTDRPYRKGLSAQTALAELTKMAGKQFDNKVVEAFLRAFQDNEFKSILKERSTS